MEEIAHLHMFSKLGLWRIAPLRIFAQGDLWELFMSCICYSGMSYMSYMNYTCFPQLELWER